MRKISNKAQRIYNGTMARIRIMLKEYEGEDIRKDFAVSFETRDDEVVCTRTVNELEYLNESKKRAYESFVKHGVAKRNPIREQSFENMELSIKHWRKREEEFKKSLASFH